MHCNPHTAAFVERYNLAKRLPDMARGFEIETGHGPLLITGAEVRQYPDLLRTVETVLRDRLDRAERVGGAA